MKYFDEPTPVETGKDDSIDNYPIETLLEMLKTANRNAHDAMRYREKINALVNDKIKMASAMHAECINEYREITSRSEYNEYAQPEIEKIIKGSF
jgi:hypothetical protein